MGGLDLVAGRGASPRRRRGPELDPGRPPCRAGSSRPGRRSRRRRAPRRSGRSRAAGSRRPGPARPPGADAQHPRGDLPRRVRGDPLCGLVGRRCARRAGPTASRRRARRSRRRASGRGPRAGPREGVARARRRTVRVSVSRRDPGEQRRRQRAQQLGRPQREADPASRRRAAGRCAAGSAGRRRAARAGRPSRAGGVAGCSRWLPWSTRTPADLEGAGEPAHPVGPLEHGDLVTAPGRPPGGGQARPGRPRARRQVPGCSPPRRYRAAPGRPAPALG